VSVSRDEVRRIAALARIRLDEATAERLTSELNRILEHVDTLAEADVSGIDEPLRLPDAPVPFRDPDLRPDLLEEGAPAAQAPDWREGFFAVPRLPGLEGEDRGRGVAGEAGVESEEARGGDPEGEP
jgi:aspartyl-tRNA(Asn)/glutamyl-tRNA(Gln) amidotransferase subunit C